MKILNVSIQIVFILLIAVTLTTCKKELSEEEKREAIISDMLGDIAADSLANNILWLQNMGNRFTLTDNRRQVAVKIRKRFELLGYDDVEIDSFYINKIYRSINYDQWQYNVTATLQGTDKPDSLCVIGAHYDNILNSGDPFTIVPGANDNASGVAGVLEIARVIALNNYQPKSTIKFVAFGAEELGLLGSKAFATDPQGYFSKIRFMVNFDMIAYEPSLNPLSWIVNILDYDNSHTLRKEAERMCAKYTRLQYLNNNTSNKQSDSYSFFTNGYKAVFFFASSVDPNYHTLNDIAANCNFNYSSEIVKAGCALLINKN